MKKVFIATVSILLGILSHAQNVQLDLTNLPQKGSLMIGVAQSQSQWESKNFVATQSYQLDGKQQSIQVYFDLPEKENYGVAIYVDANNNYQFDYGSEFYGFSNGFVPRGVPTYSDFEFSLEGTHKEKIALRK